MQRVEWSHLQYFKVNTFLELCQSRADRMLWQRFAPRQKLGNYQMEGGYWLWKEISVIKRSAQFLSVIDSCNWYKSVRPNDFEYDACNFNLCFFYVFWEGKQQRSRARKPSRPLLWPLELQCICLVDLAASLALHALCGRAACSLNNLVFNLMRCLPICIKCAWSQQQLLKLFAAIYLIVIVFAVAIALLIVVVLF